MNRFVPRSLRPAMCLAAMSLNLFLASNQPMTAQSVTPADGPKPVIDDRPADESVTPAAAPSLVLELRDAGVTYKERLDQAREAYHAITIPPQKLAQLQTAEKIFRDHPDDPHAAAQFADAFSDALQAFDDQLKKFLDLREGIEKQHTAFVASTKAAIEAVKKERERHQNAERTSAQQIQEMETALDAITTEFRDLIDKGEPLPPEIDRQVVRLANLIEQRQIAQQLHADRVKRSVSNLKKLEASLAGGNRAMDRLFLRFEKADGDRSLIGEIAAAKADELTPDPVNFADEKEEEFAVFDLRPFLKSNAEDVEPVEIESVAESRSLGGSKLLRDRLKKQAETAKSAPATEGGSSSKVVKDSGVTK